MNIHLNNLKFYSFHGVHEEETLLGGVFEVNIDIEIYQSQKIDSLHQTINYVDVYEIVKQRIAIATPLLETLVDDLINIIHQYAASLIKSVSISIKKINPPIQNFIGSVSVSKKKIFK
ncbi:MAG: dihydroneopterin aldolase [Ferruginibacter sp.]|nr:dihydroneopterin aldolase [Ferruginibacter sp.]